MVVSGLLVIAVRDDEGGVSPVASHDPAIRVDPLIERSPIDTLG